MKQKTGPIPTSCITCRRRKKRCDRTHPLCMRCKDSGFVCLGYEPREPLAVREGEPSSVLTYSRQNYVTQNAQITPDSIPPVKPTSSLLALSWSPGRPLDTWNNHSSQDYSDGSLPQPSTQHQVQPIEQTLAGYNASYGLPPRLIPDPQISGLSIKFILSEYEPLIELIFFRPTHTQIETLRRKYVNRITSSRAAHWASYIGAQLFRALKQDRKQTGLGQFTLSLDHLSQLCVTLGAGSSLDDMSSCLSGALELAFLMHMSSNSTSAYALLRHIAPVFMQVAFADPTLWPYDLSSSGISLAHALISPRPEVIRFVFIDMITSLVFSTPPLVEYDLSHPIVRASKFYGLELIHGCPAIFAFLIMKISQWRDRCPNRCSEENAPWNEIESNAWGWRGSSKYEHELEASSYIPRIAVQEAWRHALLIYLYMGMCGLNSHDPRIQSSVRQIACLYNVTKTQPTLRTHLIVPILLAGICTLSERYRHEFRMAFSRAGHSKTWLLRGLGFASVLDHLWEGAAADGGAVTWNDYVDSRKAVIDLGV